MKLCDLHTHSLFSDGEFTPERIIDLAIEKGLCAVALTDHNTVNGLPDFISAGQDKNIEIVAGAEFSSDYHGMDLHIIGLFIAPEQFERVSALMQAVNKRKEESNIALIDALNQAGYQLEYDEIKKSHPNALINRAHIAAAMVEKGYLKTVSEGFKTVLSEESGYYKEPKRPTAYEIIDFIDSIGAVSVMAHPFLKLNEEELVEFLSTAQGLDGMECYYSTYDASTIQKSIEIADRFGLIKSGGSDFHGVNKPDIQLGSGKGALAIPMSCYENLKERWLAKNKQ